MRDPYTIIVRPLLTEKSTDQASHNKYHFRVAVDANKIEIAQAVQAIYGRAGIKVLAVNTLNVKGKKKRALVKGGKPGYSAKWKKAIVTLAAGNKIEFFEGV